MKHKSKASLGHLNLNKLRLLFDYNPETGVLIRNKRPIKSFHDERSGKIWNTRYSGKPAGMLSDQGYVVLTIDGVSYKAHRLIYLIFHGVIPNDIDHINGITNDNRIANLRSVSKTENQRNKKLSRNNTSGFTGVFWGKQYNKWIARVKVNNKNIHLGSYSDIEDAISARKAANIKYGFHINHGNR